MSTVPPATTLREVMRWLEEERFYPAQKIADDGSQIVAVCPMIYTWAILVGIDAGGSKGRYCYADCASAFAAYEDWNGNAGTEPAGWIRHPMTGRRRPDGDETREYIAP